MRVIIVGCGRVGAWVAAQLDQRGEHVTVIDHNARAFNRLPADFGGETVRGNGTDEDVLRSAGTEQADIVMSLTEGDNRNALAAQVAKHSFGVPRVVAKINDPLRGEAYRALGLETICRTVILGDALVVAALDGAEATNGFVEPATAEPLRGAPTPGSRADREAQAAMDEVDTPVADANIIQGGDGRAGGL
ncbi:MAG TPA: TrkA family potassium uptake protein [Candidatus Limnocylindrales bacterium]|jgi:trk system potassium uptake protein|nr:TrkA family potassium uptake protein [Candidatus Limnocylindrales bacterium]